MDTDRRLLEELEPALREWGDGQACAMLALVARDGVSFDEDELHAALRRAVLVLAAGGDPHRELEPDGPALTSLAEELDTPERRAELQGALRRLHEDADSVPRAAYLLEAMLEDGELAWRSLAVALLAEELGDE